MRPADAKNKTRMAYGEAWRDHGVVPHQRELANIEKMKELRSKGYSYWKIAEVFNSMGIATKARRKWHARSVQQILIGWKPCIDIYTNYSYIEMWGNWVTKRVVWEGNSKDVLRSFPDLIRKDLGTGLMYLQCGALPRDAKPFKTGMPGTWELRSKDASGQYRAIYVCVVKDKIHVLHCFKKKSAQTSSLDVQTAQLRYKNLTQRIRHEKI